MCFDFLYTTLSETFLILRRNEQDIIENVHRSSYNIFVILADINETQNFSTDFRSKILKHQF